MIQLNLIQIKLNKIKQILTCHQMRIFYFCVTDSITLRGDPFEYSLFFLYFSYYFLIIFLIKTKLLLPYVDDIKIFLNIVSFIFVYTLPYKLTNVNPTYSLNPVILLLEHISLRTLCNIDKQDNDIFVLFFFFFLVSVLILKQRMPSKALILLNITQNEILNYNCIWSLYYAYVHFIIGFHLVF